MKSSDLEVTLREITAGQWGMLTTAQARARGISRANLANRENDGRLERMVHGVYRLEGSATSPLDSVRAAWLATIPESLAHERTRTPDVIVGSAAAAFVYGLGDIEPYPYIMISRGRRQTRRAEIAYSNRNVEERDVVIRDGLPITSVERTIADLLRDYGDLSLVSDALRDALDGPADIDTQRLSHLLRPLARRYELHEGDGVALFQKLLTAAERDDESRAVVSLTENPVLRAAVREMLRLHGGQLNANLQPLLSPTSLARVLFSVEAPKTALTNTGNDTARLTSLMKAFTASHVGDDA